ncbi:MAG: protein YgfX [Sterolibacterium sp.]
MRLPHRLVLRSSRYLAIVLVLLHLAALASLLPLDFPAWLKLALVATIGVSVGAAVRRHALLLATASIRELVLKSDGAVEGLRQGGSRFDASVSGQTTVLPWLIVMLLELPDSRRLLPLLILPDSLPAEDGRILRAWLRWKLT